MNSNRPLRTGRNHSPPGAMWCLGFGLANLATIMASKFIVGYRRERKREFYALYIERWIWRGEGYKNSLVWEACLPPGNIMSSWLGLLPRVMPGSVVLPAPSVRVYAPGLYYHWRPWEYVGSGHHLWPHRCQKATPLHKHPDLNDLSCCLGPWSSSGLSCGQEPCLGPWPYPSQDQCWCLQCLLPSGQCACPQSRPPPLAALWSKGHPAVGVMLIWVVSALLLGATAASGPQLLPRTISGSMVLQQPGSVMISMACAAPKGHTDAQIQG